MFSPFSALFSERANSVFSFEYIYFCIYYLPHTSTDIHGFTKAFSLHLSIVRMCCQLHHKIAFCKNHPDGSCTPEGTGMCPDFVYAVD